MDRLVSKIIAGGLSAGVFLFWWPEHVAGDGLPELILRGLLWTLSFELLLFTLGPAEQLLQRRIRARSVARGERVRTRLEGVPAPARAGGAVALACCGLAAPLTLLADAPKQLVQHVERPRVVKQVIVERPVIEKKVVVHKLVAPPQQPLQSAGGAPSATVAQVARPVARKTTTVASERTATERTAAAKGETTSPTPKAPVGSATTPTSSAGAPASGTQSDAPAPADASATPAR